MLLYVNVFKSRVFSCFWFLKKYRMWYRVKRVFDSTLSISHSCINFMHAVTIVKATYVTTELEERSCEDALMTSCYVTPRCVIIDIIVIIIISNIIIIISSSRAYKVPVLFSQQVDTVSSCTRRSPMKLRINWKHANVNTSALSTS